MDEWSVNYVAATPLHEQLKSKMIAHIKSGMLTKENPLPTVKKLSRIVAVSIATAERAYRELAKEGVVQYAKGKGYFIADTEREFI
jgi:GntR family transcriptional regulator